MHSESVGNIAKALSQARKDFPQIEKTSEVAVRLKTGGTYKFQYAPIEEILKKVIPPLSKNNIALVQTIEPCESGNVMLTKLIHESGEYIETKLPFGNLPHNPQELGSLITYLKRYSICLTLGISADQDDDANTVSSKTESFDVQTKPSRPNPAPKKKVPAPAPIADNMGDPATRKELIDEIQGCLKILGEGMNAEEKQHLMRTRLFIDKFPEISAKPVKVLRDLKNALLKEVEFTQMKQEIKTKKPSFKLDD